MGGIAESVPYTHVDELTLVLCILLFIIYIDYLCKTAPNKRDLNLVRNSTGATFKLIGKISCKWKLIGELLEIEDGELRNINEEEHDINAKFGRVFSEWKTNAAKLPHSQDYPYTWQGFRNLLNDADLSQVSKEYFAFLDTI